MTSFLRSQLALRVRWTAKRCTHPARSAPCTRLTSPLPSPTQNFEECIGGCSGTDTNPLKHSFEVTIGKAELSTALLGEDGVAAANANCTPKRTQLFVDLFDGADSFVRRRLEPTPLRAA